METGSCCSRNCSGDCSAVYFSPWGSAVLSLHRCVLRDEACAKAVVLEAVPGSKTTVGWCEKTFGWGWDRVNCARRGRDGGLWDLTERGLGVIGVGRAGWCWIQRPLLRQEAQRRRRPSSKRGTTPPGPARPPAALLGSTGPPTAHSPPPPSQRS